MSLLLGYLVLSIALNVMLFLVAYKYRSDKLTDASYALTFIVLAVTAFGASSQSTYHVVLLLMVIVWAVRIGGFLLYRVVKRGKDGRFDGVREDFVKFGKFWLAQGLSVWVLMIPALWAFQSQGSLTWGVVAGMLLWIIGFLLEATADAQKYTFSQNPNNKNKWIATGVWRYSRHPNYFGEILVWIGLYVAAVQSLDIPQVLMAIVSPLFIAALLLFVSGIPLSLIHI